MAVTLPSSGFGGGRYATQPVATAAPQSPTTTPTTTLPPANTTGTPPSVGTAGTSISPSYLSQLFPNGIPQSSTAQAPTPPQVQSPNLVNQILQASGQLPQVGTTNVLSQVGSQLGATGLEQNVEQQLNPEFAGQQAALNEELANAGITGGSTTGADVDLANAQTTTLAGAIAPLESTAQGQILSAAQADAANQLTASGQNAGNALTTGQNSVQNILQAALADQSADTSTGQFNAGQANQLGEFNTTNQLQAGQADTSAANSLQQQLLNIQNQDWLQQLVGQQNLAAGGAGNVSNAYTSTYSQPSQSSLSGFVPNITLPTQTAAQTAAPAPAAVPAPDTSYNYNGQYDLGG